MKTRIILMLIMSIAIAFAFTACGGDDDEQLPITKTFEIVLKDGALTFEVQYKALASEAAPEYLTYIKERLEAITTSDVNTNIAAVDNLIANGGNNQTIVVEYDGNVYDGLVWDTVTRTFKTHNDWISEAYGTDLSLAIMRNAFNSIEIAMLRHNSRNTIRLAKSNTINSNLFAKQELA